MGFMCLIKTRPRHERSWEKNSKRLVVYVVSSMVGVEEY